MDAYVSDGIGELDRKKLPDLLELKYRSATEGAAELGGPEVVAKALWGFKGIYSKSKYNLSSLNELEITG